MTETACEPTPVAADDPACEVARLAGGLSDTIRRSTDALLALARLDEPDSREAAYALYRSAQVILGELQGRLAKSHPHLLRGIGLETGHPEFPVLVSTTSPGDFELDPQGWMELIGARNAEVRIKGRKKSKLRNTCTGIAALLLVTLRQIRSGSTAFAPTMEDAAMAFIKEKPVPVPPLASDTAGAWWEAAWWLFERTYSSDYSAHPHFAKIADRKNIEEGEGKEGMKRRAARSQIRSDLRKAFETLAEEHCATSGK